MGYRWHKLGKIFAPQPDGARPWMHQFAQAPASLLLDDAVRFYFCTRPAADAQGQFVSHAAFVDMARDDLTRVVRLADEPILPLGGLGMFDEFGTYPVSVIRDGAQVRAYYGGWTRCDSVPFDVAIGCAISDDGGEHFNKLGQGPVLAASAQEPFILSGPKIRRFHDRYYLFYIAGTHWLRDQGKPEPVYRIRLATSEDGVHFTRHPHPLIAPRLGDDEAQASPDVIFAGERYHMFFCYRHGTDYRNHARGYRIGYAHSDDLLHWTRDDAQAGLDVSAEGWDSEMVSYPHVFALDGQVYMAYLGNGVGREGFGLARLEGAL